MVEVATVEVAVAVHTEVAVMVAAVRCDLFVYYYFSIFSNVRDAAQFCCLNFFRFFIAFAFDGVQAIPAAVTVVTEVTEEATAEAQAAIV
jgi:hypothetical protein